MPINAIAIDDEPPALRVIMHFCERTPGLILRASFSRTDEALRYLETNAVELVFLDINMPAVSGIELFGRLPPHVLVIFTTAYAEYAVEGFNLQALDYLLKPFTFERFEQAVLKAQTYLQLRQQAQRTEPIFVQIRADYGLYHIPTADILLVEGLDDYLKVYLKSGRPVVARLTMKALVDKLPPADFVRVHRSFIVPWARIVHVRNKVITLADREIPIGQRYEKAFFERFNPS